MDFNDTSYLWEGETVLIVEDNETSNIYFEAALRKTKAQLIWAKNGLDAVGIITKPIRLKYLFDTINHYLGAVKEK